jgi:hypothetical protein
MTLRLFIHSASKRAKTSALLDSGATENFMHLDYAKALGLPVKELEKEHKLYNVDRTGNKARALKYYTDLSVQMGTQHYNLRFYLSNLGDYKCILGYPWFAAIQPRIDWRKGWIDYAQLPIVLRTKGVRKICFLPQTVNKPRPLPKCTIGVADDEMILARILKEFWQHKKVFSEQASHWLPKHTE